MPNWGNVEKRIRTIIKDFGKGTQCTISHKSGGSSRGYIVFSSTDQADASTEIGTARVTTRVAYIQDVANEIQTGDTVTALGVSYRVRESRKYEPAQTNIAFRVTLDA